MMHTALDNATAYDLRTNPAWTISLGMLADDFVVEGRRRCSRPLRAYYAWNPRAARGPANIESMLEVLTCGVLWNHYHAGPESQPADAHDPTGAVEAIPEGHIVRAFSRFLAALWAMREFNEEARRLGRFAAFFETLPDSEARCHLSAMAGFGEWFRVRARELLGDITRQVEEFRWQATLYEGDRDDAALRARHEVEYHLNLLSAIVLNGAWRDEYEKAPKKLLVLPGCMRARQGSRCQARTTGLGLRCTACTESCAVNRARRCAERLGVATVVVEHQSAAFDRDHAEALRAEGCAIIGVACALSLQAGGWQAQNADIAAQCLPLAYPGCARHWSDGDGIATDIDTGLLRDIIAGANLAPGW